MKTIFLSYARKDRFFADLAEAVLEKEGIKIWRDMHSLRAGYPWQESIESGVASSMAVVVALSENSASSPYVTFEWAYGLGKGKPIIPLKLEECEIHPRLASIQYLDFSVSSYLPWKTLVERIKDIEVELGDPASVIPDIQDAGKPSDRGIEDTVVVDILGYMRRRGFQIVSYNRIRSVVNKDLTDADINLLVEGNPHLFAKSKVVGGSPAIKKIVP